MKNLLKNFIWTLALFTLTSHAGLRVGALAGGNFSTFRSTARTDAGNGPFSIGPSGQFGWQIGGILRWDQPDWGIEVDGILAHRSMRMVGTDEFPTPDIKYTITTSINEFEIPLIGYFKFSPENTDFRFGLGVVTTYGVGSIKETSTANNGSSSASATSNSSWKDYGFRRLNFGGVIAIGADWNIASALSLGVEVRGQSIFTDMGSTASPRFSGGRVNYNSIDLLLSLMF